MDSVHILEERLRVRSQIQATAKLLPPLKTLVPSPVVQLVSLRWYLSFHVEHLS